MAINIVMSVDKSTSICYNLETVNINYQSLFIFNQCTRL